jgi:hypothetical protein
MMKATSRKRKTQTVLESVIEQQRLLKLLERDLRSAKELQGTLRETFVRRSISRLAELYSDHWTPLIEWWKMEYFKRQWASGFCYHCQGDGHTMESTGVPKHPMRAVKCSECLGKGHVAPRQPRGSMIPAGQEPKPKKTKKRGA